MRHKNNPYMTLNYGVLGKGDTKSEYTLRIGDYAQDTSSKYWEVWAKRNPKFERNITYREAVMLFNKIKENIIDGYPHKAKKGIKLLKKGDYQFIKGRHNFLVYSYIEQNVWRNRQRCYISFEPIKEGDPNWADMTYDYLPSIIKPKEV